MAPKRIYRIDLLSNTGWSFSPQQVDMVYQDGYPVFTVDFEGADDASEMVDMYNSGQLRNVVFTVTVRIENYVEIINAKNLIVTDMDSSETLEGYRVTAKIMAKAAKEASLIPMNFYSLGKYDYTIREFMEAVIAQFNVGKAADEQLVKSVLFYAPEDVVYCGPYRFWRQSALQILRAVGSYHGLIVIVDVNNVVKVFHLPSIQYGSQKRVAKHQFNALSLSINVVGREV